MATSSQTSINGDQTLIKAMTLDKTQDNTVVIRKIFDNWYKTRPDVSSYALNRRRKARWLWARDLYRLLNEALETSSNPMSAANIVAELDSCLGDDQMDIYRKWWLLRECVENDPEDLAQNLARSISKTLPSLSLISAENHGALLSDDTKNEVERMSPLHRAVQQGAIKIFKVMVAEGTRALGKTRFSELLEQRDYSKNTLFSIAVEHYEPEIVRDLFELGVNTAGDTHLDEYFHQAINRVSETPTLREKAIRVISDILSFGHGFRTANNLVRAIRTGDEELVNLFMDDSSDPCPFHDFVAKKIIEHNQWKIWGLASVKRELERSKTKGLLHHAVQHQRPRFVEHFLTHTPDAVAEKVPLDDETSEEGKFPLWHNNHVITSSQTKARMDTDPDKKNITNVIRNLLVTTMIKTQKMSIIADIIWDSKGTIFSL